MSNLSPTIALISDNLCALLVAKTNFFLDVFFSITILFMSLVEPCSPLQRAKITRKKVTVVLYSEKRLWLYEMHSFPFSCSSLLI
jgi:hypothetical protein